MKKLKLVAILLLSVVALFTSCSKDSKSETITIVHKNYTEQRLIGEAMGQYLDAKGFKTEVKELGGSMLCFNALKEDNADMYFEYTGTVYGSVFNKTEVLSAEDTYNYVKSETEKQYGITWLKPFGFNNTYVLSVTKQKAEENGYKTISDLASDADKLILGGDQEFAVREGDGYPALKKKYGFEFKSYKGMDQGLTYQALVNGEIDINTSFSTDGRIAKYNLINLIDDKGAFPPYYCTPIMKSEFATSHPEVVAALNALSGKFTDQDMQKYNLMIDEGESVSSVATKLLKDKNLI